jgi:methionine-rich copper-binding protein CopC
MTNRWNAMALIAGLAIAAPVPAFAHAFLTQSNPRVGSTVNTVPKTLLLTFTEGLEVPFCRVSVTDGMGMHADAGKPQAVPGHRNELLVPLKVPMPGTYTVTWHALSVDTHRTQGHFSFTVK